MIYDPTIIDLLAHQVLNCVCAELDATAALDGMDDQPGCPCRLAVTVGTPLLAICGTDCVDPLRQGQLYVNVVRTYRSSNFPLADQTADCKAATIAVELVVTLVRCAPTMDGKGSPPTPEQLNAFATIVHTDMHTVMQAILCCVPEDPRRPTKRRRIAIIDSRTKSTDGTVAGFELRFVVDLNDPCGCRPEEVS